MPAIDIQLSPGHVDWRAVREAALEAEANGFSAVWVYDHLAGRSINADRMLECFTCLGALAEATTQIELGTLVANVWNRGVGTLATAAASVALVSGRRFHLGIGAGASPDSKWAFEQHRVGVEPRPSVAERHARVVELLDLTDRLWSPTRPPDDSTFPLPSPAPARIVGVSGHRLARLAGERADGVNVAWHTPNALALLATASEAAGARPFTRTVWTTYDDALLDPAHPERVAMSTAGVDRVILARFGDYASQPLGRPTV